MRGYRVFVDAFTAGLDELSRKDQSSDVAVLRHLKKVGKFSAFEATATPALAKTMSRLFGYTSKRTPGKDAEPLVREVGNEGYPWTRVELTEAGEKRLADG